MAFILEPAEQPRKAAFDLFAQRGARALRQGNITLRELRRFKRLLNQLPRGGLRRKESWVLERERPSANIPLARV